MSRSTITTFLITFTVCILASWALAADSSDEQQLRSLVQQFGEAWAHSDVAVLDKLLAPEYIHTDLAGKVQRRAYWLKLAGHPRSLEIEVEDLEIHIFGNVALITGDNTIWSPKDGKEKASRIRFTQLWEHNKSGWQRRAFQATNVLAK